MAHEQLSSVIQKVQHRSDDLSSQTCHQWFDFDLAAEQNEVKMAVVFNVATTVE